jgi:hypothetical protein
MKKFLTRWKRSAAALGAMAVCIAASGAQAALLGPYSADTNTVYLYHLDEAAGASSAANAGSAGYAAISYQGQPFAGVNVDQPTITSVLGATGYAGFGRAADLSANNQIGLGVDVSGDGAYTIDERAAAPTSVDRQPNHSGIFGAGNAFTLEALIKLPALTGNREIICTDNGDDNNADRGFQFRTSGGNLEFNFIGVNTGSNTRPIPTTGPDAFVANEWFHAALAYDGANFQMYWTRVDPSRTIAATLGAIGAEGVDVNDAAALVIGNEGRNSNGVPASPAVADGSNEGLAGFIDEVRISNVARTADQFIFGVPEPSTAVMAVAGLLLAGVRRRRDG